MMTQFQTIAATEPALAETEFEQYIEAQALAIGSSALNCSFGALTLATQNILRHALFLASQKENLSKTEYRKLLAERGWKGEEKKYLKVATAFKQFSPQDLAHIEPATIFRLANNTNKYQLVLDQLQNLTEINQSAVRELVNKQRKPREAKPEKPSIWRRTKNGGRYCQVPPIHEPDERTGTTLQKMMDSEGLTAQQIVAEAIALRQAYREGRLVLVEQRGTEPSPEIRTTRTTSKTEQQRSGDGEQAPFNNDSADSTHTTNSGSCEVEEALASQMDEEETQFEHQNQSEELAVGIWDCKPEPDISQNLGEKLLIVFESKTEFSPTEYLIRTFKNATSWAEIREALLTHNDYKRFAWQALLPAERKRVMGLMPVAIKKLSEAKKAKLIVEFQEQSDGVYSIQFQGWLIPQLVSESNLDAFLTQLQEKSTVNGQQSTRNIYE